jgi:hypothetical protein
MDIPILSDSLSPHVSDPRIPYLDVPALRLDLRRSRRRTRRRHPARHALGRCAGQLELPRMRGAQG